MHVQSSEEFMSSISDDLKHLIRHGLQYDFGHVEQSTRSLSGMSEQIAQISSLISPSTIKKFLSAASCLYSVCLEQMLGIVSYHTYEIVMNVPSYRCTASRGSIQPQKSSRALTDAARTRYPACWSCFRRRRHRTGLLELRDLEAFAADQGSSRD